MAEKISWHPPDAALRPASHFECALRRRRKIGFCPPTARWLRVAMLGLSARPSAASLSSYRKVPRLGERVQEPTTTACVPTLPTRVLHQIVSNLRYTGRDGNVDVTAAFDPKRDIGRTTRTVVEIWRQHHFQKRLSHSHSAPQTCQ